MKKNIWIINQDVLTPAYGYMQHRHFFIASGLQKMGYEVNILTSSYNHFLTLVPPSDKTYNFEEINNVLFCWIKGLKYKKPNGFRRILGWLHFTTLLFFVPKKKLVRPDIIIFSSTGLFPILAAWYFKKKYGASLIVEIRDVWPMTLVEVGKISPAHPLVILLGMLEKFSYNNADLIVGTMPNLSKRIHEVTNRNVPFAFIPQGIDLDFVKTMTPLPDAFKKEYFQGPKFTIGYAGTIGTSNALEDLLRAAEVLYPEIPDLRVIILGDGPKKKELENAYAHCKYVRFAPKIPKYAVNAFLEECDLLFDGVYSANIYTYGLSRNKWIDYMFSGRPIVVSYTGFLSMLNEANCGEAVAVGNIDVLVDAIRRYRNMSPEERKEIGLRGKKFILNNHTFENITSLYDQAIKTVANLKV